MRILITVTGLVLTLAVCTAQAQSGWAPPTEVQRIAIYACPDHPRIMATWPARCPYCQTTLQRVAAPAGGAAGGARGGGAAAAGAARGGGSSAAAGGRAGTVSPQAQQPMQQGREFGERGFRGQEFGERFPNEERRERFRGEEFGEQFPNGEFRERQFGFPNEEFGDRFPDEGFRGRFRGDEFGEGFPNEGFEEPFGEGEFGEGFFGPQEVFPRERFGSGDQFGEQGMPDELAQPGFGEG